MTPEFTSPQRKVLGGIANAELVQEAAAKEARRAMAAAEVEVRARRERMVARARKAEAARLEAAEDFERAIREAMEALRTMLATAPDLLRLPGSAAAVSKRGALVRVSRWLAGQLFAVAQSGDYFGGLRLHYTGRPRAIDSFAESERATMAALFVEPEEEGPTPNGRDNETTD